MTLKVSSILTAKQLTAFERLEDSTTVEILYGGGAGGGKSWLGCFWLCIMCMQYPGSRWLMGRSVLKNLKQTTLKSFWEVVKMLKWGSLIEYKEQKGEIHFSNGSEIVLKDLAFYPSDPNFESLGSLEITGAFIDECSQIVKKAKDIVLSRIRYKLDDFEVIPKILMTCNPSKNWVYSDFYKLDKMGKLTNDKCFIPALVTDNKHISRHYITNLHKLSETDKQRLLYGNFDYDNDPMVMLPYDVIEDMFTNVTYGGEYYMIVDPAGKGKDEMNISVFKGYSLIYFEQYETNDNVQIISYMNRIKSKYGIGNRNICFDVVGVGFGLTGSFPGAYEFSSGSRAIGTTDSGQRIYNSLRDECGYKLEELCKQSKLGVSANMASNIMDNFKADLAQLKEFPKNDKLKYILPKSQIVSSIGRSPTWLDIFLMRMVFELGGKKGFGIIT